MTLAQHHKGMKIAVNDVAFRRGGFPLRSNPPGHGFSGSSEILFSEELPMTLAQHHKGMKIAVNDPYFVGEGLQTLPDTAVPCPYMIVLRSRNLFSRERSVHERGSFSNGHEPVPCAIGRRGGLPNPPGHGTAVSLHGFTQPR
jgi:hypothetical protein